MKFRRAISLVGTLLILISILWIPDPSRVLGLIARGSLHALSVVLLLYFTNLFVKAYRWNLLLNVSGEMRLRRSLPYYTVALAINNLFPGRVAGEPFRILYIKADADYPLGAGTASIAMEKCIDLFVVTAMALAGTIVMARNLERDVQMTIIATSLAILIVLGLSLYAVITGRTSALLNRISRLRPLAIFEKALIFMGSFERGIYGTFRKRGTAVSVSFLTIFIWINEAVRLYLIYVWFLPSGEIVDPGPIMVAITTATLLSIALPAGGGSLLGLSAILTAFGFPKDRVASASLVSVATSIWLSFLVGALAMAYILKSTCNVSDNEG